MSLRDIAVTTMDTLYYLCLSMSLDLSWVCHLVNSVILATHTATIGLLKLSMSVHNLLAFVCPVISTV